MDPDTPILTGPTKAAPTARSLRALGFCGALSLLCVLETVTSRAQDLPDAQVIGPSWVYEVQGLYHNVRSDLVTAIEDRGLVISYVANLASMLRRTAEATGATVQVYDNAETLLFCKSDLTYELTVRNPHHMTLCPYSIAVYSLKAEPGTVFLAIPTPDLALAEYAAIHQLLEGIIGDTLSWYRE